MLVKNPGTRATNPRLLPWIVPVVFLGVGLGLRWTGAGTGSDGNPAGDARGALETFLVPKAGGARDDPGSGLTRLAFDLSPASARRLQDVRDRALETGIIIQEEQDTVPARLHVEDRDLPALVRIKGDWLDHVDTDQWSLRVRLEEPALFGMRLFSIQAPETVGLMWEWLVHAAMRAEGVLAPRSTFVEVAINGNDLGVYFLQEHFSKELLESQARREGPIVRWDENTHWDVLLQHGLTLPGPAPVRSGLVIDTAPVLAFGEKRLSSIESLSRGLDGAVEKMRALRALAVAARGSAEKRRRLRALEELQETELERLLNIDRLAAAHAVASLFQVEHALFWHNMRFYHDPVLDRLEPILFDNMAHMPAERDPVPLRGSGFVTRFRVSRPYYDGVFWHLGRLVQPGYLEAFLESVAPELARFAGSFPAGESERMRARLLEQRDYLARIALPVRGANFAGTFELAPDSGSEGNGTIDGSLEVLAWATTRAPMLIEGFRFANGSVVRAREALLDGADPGARSIAQGVVLPSDGRAVTFRFPMDARLANLGNVRELKKALREESGAAGAMTAPALEVEVLQRPLASRAPASATPLFFRRSDPRWRVEGGRPVAPSVETVLERHPFLEFDLVSGQLLAGPGSFAVAGDLVVPDEITLVLRAGTELTFEPDAILVSTAPLLFEGTAEAPVVLGPREAPVPGQLGAGWGGVAVLEAGGRSRWSHVTVRETHGIVRGGWNLTGGVTFHRSPVDFSRCLFEGSRAEDGLNVIRTDVLLEGTRFVDFDSDAFDGDFVSGRAVACQFRSGAGDGIDLSGSDFVVENSRFEDIADKALSAGERTHLSVQGGLVKDVSIGIASKDGSRVEVAGLGIEAVRHFAFAVYVKKPAYGPARLSAERMRLDEAAAGALLVQTGCELLLDGQAVETRELDVQDLYQRGILGR